MNNRVSSSLFSLETFMQESTLEWCVHLATVKQTLPKSQSELRCQLCFEEIPSKEHEKHLMEYHKIAIKAVENKKPLQSWFGSTE